LTNTATEEKIMTPYFEICDFALTYKSRMPFTGSAHVTCAVAMRDRFILSGRASCLRFCTQIFEHIPVLVKIRQVI